MIAKGAEGVLQGKQRRATVGNPPSVHLFCPSADLALLHSCTCVSLVTGPSHTLDHSSKAVALAQAVPEKSAHTKPFQHGSGARSRA